jgi:hypothetical protein
MRTTLRSLPIASTRKGRKEGGALRPMRCALLVLASCHLTHCLHVAPPASPMIHCLASSRAPAPLCLATGDRVKVISDVPSKGVATLGMVGTVLDMWKQDAENWGSCCELDPACAASVTVRLDPPLGYYEVSEVQRIDGSRTGDLVEGEEVCVCRDVGAKGIPNTNGMTGAASL